MTIPQSRLVVPHAGYVYSGRVAASAYRRLAAQRGHIRRVVILGPAHFARRADAAVPECRAFATPLGEIEVDQSGCALAAGLPAVTLSTGAHAREHSIEVQLPFLQRSLGPDISIVPIAVGRVETRLLADVISALWMDDSTAVVISTDLSHYQDQATAEQLRRTHRRSDPAAGPARNWRARRVRTLPAAGAARSHAGALTRYASTRSAHVSGHHR